MRDDQLSSEAAAQPYHLRPWARVLMVAAVAPAAIVLMTEAAFSNAARQQWSFSSSALLYGLMAGQIALLSVGVGKLLASWPWRLIVFGWALALVHLSLYRATATDVGWSWQQHPVMLLAYAFVSAEISAVAAWAILGTLAWPLRLPLAAILGAAIVKAYPITQSQYYADKWIVSLQMQIIAIVILSFALRMTGYRIQKDAGATPQDRRPKQFTLYHLFAWTTTIAVLVGILRLMDFSESPLVPQSTRDSANWLRCVLLGGTFSVVGLAAFWTTLGAGHWAFRLPVFVAAAVITGLAARWIAGGGPYWGAGQSEWRWLVWTSLAQSFLAALLLLFQSAGYRLLGVGDKS